MGGWPVPFIIGWGHTLQIAYFPPVTCCARLRTVENRLAGNKTLPDQNRTSFAGHRSGQQKTSLTYRRGGGETPERLWRHPPDRDTARRLSHGIYRLAVTVGSARVCKTKESCPLRSGPFRG
jgi:hypothetical protein